MLELKFSLNPLAFENKVHCASLLQNEAQEAPAAQQAADLMANSTKEGPARRPA
jgi:hypothetical protein